MTGNEISINSINSIEPEDANNKIEQQNPNILDAQQEAETSHIMGKSKLNGHINSIKIGAIYFFPSVLALIVILILISYGIILNSLSDDLLQSKIENWISAGFSFSFGVAATIVYNHFSSHK
jgi:hypothetical protein